MRKVVGVDISKAKINYCLVAEDGEILNEGVESNDLDGFEQLLNVITPMDVEIIFEATGVYSRRFQYFLNLHEIYYVRMNPLQAKKEMDGLRITKNDSIDAKQLAILQLRKKYAASAVEEQVYLELRSQHRYYQEVAEDGAKAKNRLHKCLQDTFSEIEKLFVGETDTFYKMIELVPHADMVKGKSEKQVAAIIQPIYGKSVKRATTVAKKLIDLANRTAVSVPMNSCLVEQSRHWATMVLQIKKQKQLIVDSMSVIAEEVDDVQIAESIPGFGRVHALGLIAELGSIKRFRTPQKINAFVGIDLRFNDSGQLKTNGFTTKRGNSMARKILFDMAIGVIAAEGRGLSSNISKWYKRRSVECKGSKKKILIGVMDRILRLIHHLITENEMFSYQ